MSTNGLNRYTYGSKSAGREKSALNGNNQASLRDLPCPNHPSYRLGSFTQLEIYCMPTCTMISRLLGLQETCAGKGSCFLLFQEIWISEILMTIYKAYLVALRATVTLTYIPVMTPWLYDTFPGAPRTFPGHIRSFPGPFFYENIDILAKIGSQTYLISEVLFCV